MGPQRVEHYVVTEQQGVCPGLVLEVWLRWFAHPFVVLSAGGHVQYPVFAPDT